MISWFTSLLDRIPRPAYQLGLFWGIDEVQWSPAGSNAIMVVYSKEKCSEEINSYQEETIRGGSCACYRKIWISPAKVRSLGEFKGW